MLIDVDNVNQVSPTSGYAILSKTHGMFYIQVGGGCGGRRRRGERKRREREKRSEERMKEKIFLICFIFIIM